MRSHYVGVLYNCVGLSIAEIVEYRIRAKEPGKIEDGLQTVLRSRHCILHGAIVV